MPNRVEIIKNGQYNSFYLYLKIPSPNYPFNYFIK